MKRAAIVLALLILSCTHIYQSDGTIKLRPALHVTDVHFPGWDYCPNVGWRHVTPEGQSQCDCFDEEGNVLPACAACYTNEIKIVKRWNGSGSSDGASPTSPNWSYSKVGADRNYRLIPGCIAGYYTREKGAEYKAAMVAEAKAHRRKHWWYFIWD